MAFLNADWRDFESTPASKENPDNSITIFDYHRLLPKPDDFVLCLLISDFWHRSPISDLRPLSSDLCLLLSDLRPLTSDLRTLISVSPLSLIVENVTPPWFTGLGYYFTTRENCLIKRHFFSMRRRNVWLSASICGALAIGCTIPGLSAGKMAHLIKK